MKTVRVLYLVFANTLVLFFFILFTAHCFNLLRARMPASSGYLRLPEVVKSNYAHMPVSDVDALLTATESISYQYEHWIGFTTAAQISKFVNVNEFGIRANAKPGRNMSALENAIWLFGGSTAFGHGVSDEETIPAQVEKALMTPVVNFGVPDFYSAQENMLLAQYLKSGYRPSLVLFLDGINERCNIGYQAELKLMFAKAQIEYEWDFLEIAKPVLPGLRRVASQLKQYITGGAGTPAGDEFACENHGAKIPLSTVHSRNLAERESICRLYE
jgi:hypothetical protein